MLNFKYDVKKGKEVGNIAYQHNAENNRIGKIENGETTTYIVDTTSGAFSKVPVDKKGSTIRQYIYATGLIMHVEGG